MTKRTWNNQILDWDEEVVGSYPTPIQGAYLTDPVTDDDHVMGDDIFQLNPGAYSPSSVELYAPPPYGNLPVEYEGGLTDFVYPQIPLMIGGIGESQFVGGIHSSEISSITFTNIPTSISPGEMGLTYELGDVNADTFLNILDVVGIVNTILDIEANTHPVLGTILGDYNQDSFLNILDGVGLVDYILYGE